MSRRKSSFAMSPQANALPPELVESLALAAYMEKGHIPKKADTYGDYETFAKAIGARLVSSGWRLEKRKQQYD